MQPLLTQRQCAEMLVLSERTTGTPQTIGAWAEVSAHSSQREVSARRC
jgi:hypothetical protein